MGGFPLDDGIVIDMRAEPELGTLYNLIKWFGLRVPLQFGLALFLVHPQNGVVTVAVYGLADALLLLQCQCMDNGKELSDVVCAVHWPETEHLLTGGQVDAAILHLAGIAAACRINSPCVCPYPKGQGQQSPGQFPPLSQSNMDEEIPF